MEIRQVLQRISPQTGMLYGEALTTGWLTSQKKIDEGHPYSVAEGWNKLRIVAKGPRIQTWVNGHLVDDVTNEEVYKTHKKGFIGLQIHSITDREINLPSTPEWASRRASP